jgi:multidrug resistance efflux pump
MRFHDAVKVVTLQLRWPFVLMLTVGAWTAGSAAARAGDRPRSAGPVWLQALERFGKLSPAERQGLLAKLGLADLPTVKVTRAVLALEIVERGTVEAVRNSDVLCRLKARDKGSPVASTIKWVIDNGTPVKKGDKVLELDDSFLQQELRQRKSEVDKAVAAEAKARKSLKLVHRENEIHLRLAEIAVQRAEAKLKKDGSNPDIKQELELQVELARIGLERAKFLGGPKNAEVQLQVHTLATDAAQANARWHEIEADIGNCVLRASHDGVAIYYVPEQARFGTSTPAIVAQGEPVREGQKLLQIPDLSHMQLVVRVHEALVAHLRNEDPKNKGNWQKAQIRVDAYPSRIFTGHVRTVDTVASDLDFFAADVKVYKTIVAIDSPVEGLKPGMSAEVTITARQTAGPVLQVPVQAVVAIGRRQLCFVLDAKGIQEREVITGLSSDKAVEIKAGLQEDDQVLLAPRALAWRIAPALNKAARPPAQLLRPGPTTMLVRSVKPADDGAARRTWVATYGLTKQDRRRIAALPDVVATVPVRGIPQSVSRLNRAHLAEVVATTPEYAAVNGLTLVEGRFLCDQDDLNRRNVAVLGAAIVEQLFPGDDPLGQTVVLNKSLYVVVGVVGAPAAANDSIFLPLSTCNARFGARAIIRRAGRRSAEQVALSAILVTVRDPAATRATVEAIRDILEQAHSKQDWAVEGPSGS